MSRPRRRHLLAGAATVTAAALALALAPHAETDAAAGRVTEDAAASIDPAAGIGNIDHVVVIVQENRSFDHYFGTFPGADGIPRLADGRFAPCIPDPASKRCRRPFRDTNLFDAGGPHNTRASKIAVDGGRMDGFVRALREIGNSCGGNPDRYQCVEARPGPSGTPDVMGIHARAEIPNYWTYAERYVLQDRMFAPSDSWTLPSHLYLVSAWSAICTAPRDGRTCRSELETPVSWWTQPASAPAPYGWADITWLLDERGVSWAYYVGANSCLDWPCRATKDKDSTNPLFNPLPGFQTVRRHRSMGKIRPHEDYFAAAAAGTLPSVSWLVPTAGRTEHPPDNIGNGQAWVTRAVNAVMSGPEEQRLHTAIFLVWDDWGGFYDHVQPIRIDENGYGIRVPGIMISPFAKGGTIDSQTLSFDAYLKLIEDRFLGGQRLDGKNLGWPDARPTVRENARRLGDLGLEFDWYAEPIPPLILDPTP
ncbi:MAG TPA: alkaline phosphatase family protein [Actinomycetota bacterium]|jgi:phospholipase C